MNKRDWKRPEDIRVFKTKEPREMLDKYLTKRVVKTWTEDFLDNDTGEVVSIERNEVICEAGLIDQDKLQIITFALQAGDIEEVEVADESVYSARLCKNLSQIPYMVNAGSAGKLIVNAQNIPQATRIVVDYCRTYLKRINDVFIEQVKPLSAVTVLPDDSECIPEDERRDELDLKPYFRVTVKMTWVKNCKPKKDVFEYIITADEVGQARERIMRHIDYLKETGKIDYLDENMEEKKIVVHKAVPFAVDYIVPQEFCSLYFEEE